MVKKKLKYKIIQILLAFGLSLLSIGILLPNQGMMEIGAWIILISEAYYLLNNILDIRK